MIDGAPSPLRVDDALPGLTDAGGFEAGLDAASAENQFEQTQLKTHEMQATLARAAEAGEFDGVVVARAEAGEKALLNVLALLENAKERLDKVRQRV